MKCLREEIKTVQFSKKWMGVDEKEVYEFLLRIINEYETLLLLQKTHYVALIKQRGWKI